MEITRPCRICGKESVIDDATIHALCKIQRLYSFLVCDDCSTLEVQCNPGDKMDELLVMLGKPENRKATWEMLMSRYSGLKEIFDSYLDERKFNPDGSIKW